MIIGISSRVVNVNNKESFVLYKRYINEFDNEIIMILPNQSERVLDLCDVFILTGGDDIDPKYYNEHNTSSNGVNDDMDRLDFKIIEHAFRKNKKILGICRGIQSINVYFGGDLNQHIDGHMEVSHKIYKINDDCRCDIGDVVKVNSYHHQTIKTLGVGLNALYVSGNGTVEVIKHENDKILGVQFHPEIDYDDYSKIIFNFILVD